MIRLTQYPIVFFVVALLVLSVSTRVGARFANRLQNVRDDFSVILTATLTLMGLIVGFTFSMAVSRYDQRKLYEEEEANAIGTEYTRADLLPQPAADNMRRLLRRYLDRRIAIYQTRDLQVQKRIDTATARLQQELWEVAKTASQPAPTPVTALVLAGMNDVLNSQGYTQAAWLNRIPTAAWALLSLLAILASAMIGLSFQHRLSILLWIVPTVFAVALLLISDIDSPRGGLIRVSPDNMLALSQSLGH